jgi:hypothetical protein
MTFSSLNRNLNSVFVLLVVATVISKTASAISMVSNGVRTYSSGRELRDAPGTYVSYDWSDKAELSDDMEVDHVWTTIPRSSNPNGNGVFASSQFWYHDVDGNTVAGGYMGSQVMSSGATGENDRLVFIFSCWDSDPKITGDIIRVGWTTPDTCSRFGGEGVGSHCIVEVPAIEGTLYNFTLSFDWKNETGSAWTGIVVDSSSTKRWLVGTLFYPHAKNTNTNGFGRLGTYSNEFLEYFLGGACDDDVHVGVGTFGPFFRNRTVAPTQAFPAYSTTSDCNRTEVTTCIPSGYGCDRPRVFVQGGNGVSRNNTDTTALWSSSP